MKKGGRVYVTRKELFHLLKDKAQRDVLKDLTDNHKVFGTVTDGKSNKGYSVNFDMFPAEKRRLVTLAPHEEEIQDYSDILKYLTIDDVQKERSK